MKVSVPAFALCIVALSACATAPTPAPAAPEPASPAPAPTETPPTKATSSPTPRPTATRAPAEPAGPTPLSAEHRARFFGSATDAAPDKLDGVTSAQEGKHYVAGNEWNLHLFRESLAGLGGGFIGVGSDQTYLFLGWQRPELAWQMDYDPVIADVHGVYHALFRAHDTPEAFLAAWDQPNKRATVAAIEAQLADARESHRQRIAGAYTRYRGRVRKRLVELKAALDKHGVASFLTDQETYAWIKALIESGRVRALTGNLMGRRAMKGIGDAARALGVPIRAVYVSNAEQYWKYNRAYRTNIGLLPYDDRSLFVRTLLTWKRNRDYRYVLQPMANYRAWLAKAWVRSVTQIIKPRTDDATNVEFLVFDGDVEAAEAARDARKRRIAK